MQPGDWTAATGYRHVYSHVHFSGPTENVSRQQLGTEIQSKTNLEDVMVTYQLTSRISLTGTLPFLSASRRNQSQYGTLHTSGIGDISLGAAYWLRKPLSPKASRNNAQFGLSLLVPTGSDRQTNLVATSYGATPTTQYPDYSVQPGGGSWGMIMSWQAFHDLGNNFIAFVDGDYVMTQGGYHNFWTSHGGTTNNAPAATAGLTQFDAIQDQYMVEIGCSHPAPKIKGLATTLSVRDEGVPARNLIGNDLGFRRPGFGIALTPGFIYTRGNHMFQVSIGKVLIRDRTKSVPEQINGVHEGDAAFANYVWMAGYTLRLPGKKGSAETAAVRPAAKPDGFKPFHLTTLDGTPKTLPDFPGKVRLVSFFFPQCPFCNVELPKVQKIYERYRDKGLSAVWINILPEQVNLIAGWQAQRKLTVPVLIGASQDSLQRDYGIEATPTTFLLDEKGKVLLRQDGYRPGDEVLLENRISEALGVPAPPSIP